MRTFLRKPSCRPCKKEQGSIKLQAYLQKPRSKQTTKASDQCALHHYTTATHSMYGNIMLVHDCALARYKNTHLCEIQCLFCNFLDLMAVLMFHTWVNSIGYLNKMQIATLEQSAILIWTSSKYLVKFFLSIRNECGFEIIWLQILLAQS